MGVLVVIGYTGFFKKRSETYCNKRFFSLTLHANHRSAGGSTQRCRYSRVLTDGGATIWIIEGFQSRGRESSGIKRFSLKVMLGNPACNSLTRKITWSLPCEGGRLQHRAGRGVQSCCLLSKWKDRNIWWIALMSLRGSMVPSSFVMSFPRLVAIIYSVVKYLLRAYSQSIIGLDSGDTKVNKPWPCPQRPYRLMRQINK